jgi:hypothetical protein
MERKTIMLTTDLTGNFNDHCVRYALCRTIAEHNGYQWSINPTPSHDYYNGQEQMYFFPIDYGVQPNNTPYGQLPDWVTGIWEEKRETYYHTDRCDYHPFQPDIFDVPDNTKLIIYSGQNAGYYNKSKVREWFKIKEEYRLDSERTLSANGIDLDDNNTCVINVRGGEYIGIPSLFLRRQYWEDALYYMLSINPNMRFIVITEDPNYFKSYFPYPVYHFNIHTDYYAINNAKHLILSNSGFGIFPSWLNSNAINIVAPRWWARHNTSEGKWVSSDVWTFGEGKWKFLDRDGRLYDK